MLPSIASSCCILSISEFASPTVDTRASLVAQRLKHLPAMQETWVPSLGREDPLEKEMATHCSILAWKTPWTEEPRGLQSMASQRVGQSRAAKHSSVESHL